MIGGAGDGDSGQYEEMTREGIRGLKYHGGGISGRGERTSGRADERKSYHKHT